MGLALKKVSSECSSFLKTIKSCLSDDVENSRLERILEVSEKKLIKFLLRPQALIS